MSHFFLSILCCEGTAVNGVSQIVKTALLAWLYLILCLKNAYKVV